MTLNKRWNRSSCTKLALSASWTHGLIAQSVRASGRNPVVVGSNPTQPNFLRWIPIVHQYSSISNWLETMSNIETNAEIQIIQIQHASLFPEVVVCPGYLKCTYFYKVKIGTFELCKGEIKQANVQKLKVLRYTSKRFHWCCVLAVFNKRLPLPFLWINWTWSNVTYPLLSVTHVIWLNH